MDKSKFNFGGTDKMGYQRIIYSHNNKGEEQTKYCIDANKFFKASHEYLTFKIKQYFPAHALKLETIFVRMDGVQIISIPPMKQNCHSLDIRRKLIKSD
jgi:hypothetical protein